MSETKRHEYDLVVIGGGPGGYVAAIRAAQLGHKAAVIEKEGGLGGTCLRIGCIPSKALLESSWLFREINVGFENFGITVEKPKLNLAGMMKHKQGVVEAMTRGIDALLRKNQVARYQGRGTITGPGRVMVTNGTKEDLQVAAKHIIIATGSKSTWFPGMEVDGKYVVTSTEALEFTEVPKKLIVIGAGFIGMELGCVWSRLGSEVVVLEHFHRIMPGADHEIVEHAHKVFKKQGIEFLNSSKVISARKDGNGCIVEIDSAPPMRADRVLVAVGRGPYTEGLGLDKVGIVPEKRGHIPVDENYRTSAEGIYAIGDVIAGPQLAHKAEEEAMACVEKIFTGHGHVNYDVIPAVTYTHPEIGQVGKTEEQLIEAKIEYRKGIFPFRANARARTVDELDGLVKILADAKTDRILGVHIFGAHAGELLAEAVVAMEYGASAEDLARTCHSHPTLSEVVKEAALAVAGRSVHMA